MASTKIELIKTIKQPSLKKVLDFCGLLPGEAILLGVANDELPVLLNAFSNEPCNVVIWDKLAKQGLQILKVIAEYVFKHRSKFGLRPKKVEFVVLTHYPEDWGELNKYGMGMRGNTSCIGIIPFYSELASTVIRGLCTWINERHGASKSPVIVLIDGLENITTMKESFKVDFQYLLHSGYEKNVYVIGTSSKKNIQKVQRWLEDFQMEVYGCDFDRRFDNFFEYEKDGKKIYFFAPETEIGL